MFLGSEMPCNTIQFPRFCGILSFVNFAGLVCCQIVTPRTVILLFLIGVQKSKRERGNKFKIEVLYYHSLVPGLNTYRAIFGNFQYTLDFYRICACLRNEIIHSIFLCSVESLFVACIISSGVFIGFCCCRLKMALMSVPTAILMLLFWAALKAINSFLKKSSPTPFQEVVKDEVKPKVVDQKKRDAVLKQGEWLA